MILKVEEFRCNNVIIAPKNHYEVDINFNEHGMYEINDKSLQINILHSDHSKLIDWYYYELRKLWISALNNVPHAKSRMYKYFHSINGE